MRKFFISCTLALAALVADAAPPAWEGVNAPRPEIVQEMEMDSQTEIVVRDGAIYLWVAKPTNVKIFSILGQLISSENLQPGLHRLRLTSRGIYILQAGSTTRRVTL